MRLARILVAALAFVAAPAALGAAFDVGYGPRTIAGLDADGVALAAIQGLNAKLEAKLAARDAEIAALRADLAELRTLLRQR